MNSLNSDSGFGELNNCIVQRRETSNSPSSNFGLNNCIVQLLLLNFQFFVSFLKTTAEMGIDLPRLSEAFPPDNAPKGSAPVGVKPFN